MAALVVALGLLVITQLPVLVRPLRAMREQTEVPVLAMEKVLVAVAVLQLLAQPAEPLMETVETVETVWLPA